MSRRPTDHLSDEATWPFLDDGAEEVRVRVSRRDKDGKPLCYQAWVKHPNPKVPQCLGIRANPVTAILAALERYDVLAALLERGADPRKYSLDTGKLLEPEAEHLNVEDLLA